VKKCRGGKHLPRREDTKSYPFRARRSCEYCGDKDGPFYAVDGMQLCGTCAAKLAPAMTVEAVQREGVRE
jgi:ribosomal protein S14